MATRGSSVVIRQNTVFAGGVGTSSSNDATPRRGVFPGSFNPLTIAHLALVDLARRDHGLDSIELVISEVALDKPTPPGPPLDERVALIDKDIADREWLSVRTTQHQLIADIADGYDAVLMGADKWEQVNDSSYYGSDGERDAAIERLPQVIVADRSGYDVPGEIRLETDESLHDVSSSQARDGDRSIMAPHASKEWRAD